MAFDDSKKLRSVLISFNQLQGIYEGEKGMQKLLDGNGII